MKNKIIELAQEAGFMLVTSDAFDENAWFECFPDQIKRFAELVNAAAVARERERLKQELEKMLMEMYDKGVADGLNSITAAIRGRTE
jgi:hypothetical protein